MICQIEKKNKFCISTTLPWIPTKKVLIFQCARNENSNSKNWTRKILHISKSRMTRKKNFKHRFDEIFIPGLKKDKKCLKFAHIKSDLKLSNSEFGDFETSEVNQKSRNCNFKSKCDKGFFSQKIPSFYSNYYLTVFEF